MFADFSADSKVAIRKLFTSSSQNLQRPAGLGWLDISKKNGDCAKGNEVNSDNPGRWGKRKSSECYLMIFDFGKSRCHRVRCFECCIEMPCLWFVMFFSIGL